MARTGDAWVSVPDDWTLVDSHGWGPFVTTATYQPPAGPPVEWESRLHRKRRELTDRGAAGGWWAPRSLGWWTGVLFMVGSLCFAVAAVPKFATAVGVRADSITYFVGSIFFTCAAFLQYVQTVNADPDLAPAPEHMRPRRRLRRLFTYEPHRIDWCASSVQLVGTLFFNVTTLMALNAALTTTAEIDRHVWRPDALGSVCFLVASGLAWAEVSHAWWSWQPSDSSWWIAFLNMSGSIAFGVSAVASYVVPDSGDVRNAPVVNLGTFVGAVGFFLGAVLLLPEGATAPTTEPVLTPARRS